MRHYYPYTECCLDCSRDTELCSECYDYRKKNKLEKKKVLR